MLAKKNLYLFQPQYAVEFRNEDNFWIPYSAGCLWSYASQFDDIRESWNLAGLIFRREPPEQLLTRLHDPKLCGFSCYVWNEKYCLALAQMIKLKWPECRIIFGGPQASGAMLEFDFIDSIIMAEGEEIFLEILRSLDQHRDLEKFYTKRRLEQLDIPSPYLLGVFDDIIKQNPAAIWSTVIETNRGCPFACTFCDWGGVTYSKVKKFPLDKVQKELEWCSQNSVGYIVLADANFGIFKDRDLEIAKMIRKVADQSKIDSVNIQYAKNSTDIVFEIAKTLGNLSRGITVSVQSMHESTLDAIKRANLDINDIKHMMEMSAKHKVGTYTEVILGLPLETLNTWKQGLTDLLEAGQHTSLDIWFAQPLENSELSTPESRRKYGIQTIRAQNYMPLYNKHDYRDIQEEIEIVCSTNTMTTEDLVEAYLYAWMIIHLHMSGYSQLYARYARHKFNISYQRFYEHVWHRIWCDDPISSHLRDLQITLDTYLRTGRLETQSLANSGHNIHAISYGWLYNNKQQVFGLLRSIAQDLIEIPEGLVCLQENFLVDPTRKYPIETEMDFDVVNWKNHTKKYQIWSNIEFDTEFDFYRYRRQGLVKNQIIAV